MRKALMSVIGVALLALATIAPASAGDVRQGMVTGDTPVLVTYAVDQGVLRKTKAGEGCYLRPAKVVNYHGVLDGKVAVKTTIFALESILARIEQRKSLALTIGAKWCLTDRFVHIATPEVFAEWEAALITERSKGNTPAEVTPPAGEPTEPTAPADPA